jgi:hypothetical protein
MWHISNCYKSSGTKFLAYIKNLNFLILLFLSSFSCYIFALQFLSLFIVVLSSPFAFYLFPHCFIISSYICLFIYLFIHLLLSCFVSLLLSISIFFVCVYFCCLSYSCMPMFIHLYISHVHFTDPVAYPGMFFWEASANSAEYRGQKEWGFGGSSPPVRGSTQFANELNLYSH